MPTFPEGPQLTLPFPTQEQSGLARDAAVSAYTDDSPLRRPTPIAPAAVHRPIKDWPRADRPRDKLLDRGPAALSNAELLSILLRSGPHGQTALDQARTLIAACGDDWRQLGVLGAGELHRYGLGQAKAAEILAALEIAKRYGEREWRVGEPLRGSHDVYAHFRERLAAEAVELFLCVLLDNKHRKLADIVVSKGSLTASIVHPRDVFAQVVKHRGGVAAIILCHNHPAGVMHTSGLCGVAAAERGPVRVCVALDSA
jgi:DNA repair protein RadC